MKFIATLLLFFLLTTKSTSAQFVMLTNEMTIPTLEEQEAVTVLKPPYIDVSSHFLLYGTLGPESFRTAVTFQLIKEEEIRLYGSQVVLMLNDSDIALLNATKSSQIRILITRKTLATGCWGQSSTIRDFTYLYEEPEEPSVASETQNNSLSLVPDIYPSSLLVTVKCSSSSPSRRGIDPQRPRFRYSEFMSYEGLGYCSRERITLMDPGAIALYGNFIHIVNLYPEGLQGTEYARVRLERVITLDEHNRTPVYWIKAVIPISNTQQSILTPAVSGEK